MLKKATQVQRRILLNGNDGKQHSKVNTYWTQKGRLFIYALLKNEGILPIMEQEQIA